MFSSLIKLASGALAIVGPFAAGAIIPSAGSIRSSIAAGGAGAVTAASGVKDGVQAALTGGDATAAGQQVAASFAAGITSGGAAAVAAARGVKAQVDGVLGSGGGSAGRRGLSGALHDGVD